MMHDNRRNSNQGMRKSSHFVATFVGQKWDVTELDNKPIVGVLDISSLVLTLNFVDGSVINWEGVNIKIHCIHLGNIFLGHCHHG
eukprot:4958330-Ditylum_brightwellii.AAC.1